MLRHGGRWHLLYTGVPRAEAAAAQRVGLASSGDLDSKPGTAVGTEECRDPWVVWDDDTQRFHMLVTATAVDGPDDARGVIAHATSRDLRSWEAGPPLTQPGELRQLEVPHLGGAWRILFSATVDDHGARRLRRAGVVPRRGTHSLSSAEKLGESVLAWRLHDERGQFAGELSDPMAVDVGADGSLSVDVPREHRS